ncbi:MAG: VWA domain-containing protein [bacterium]|nr:VWA domain-containing protein [bacterium]
MRTAIITSLVLFVATSLPGQEVTIDLVDLEVYPRIKVYATVTDAEGIPQCRLPAEDFQLWELDEPQRLRVISGEQTATSVGLLLDESSSMDDVVSEVRSAAQSFVRLLSGSDRAITCSFDDRVYCQDSMLDLGVGLNKQALVDSLDEYPRTRGGGTMLYDAVDELIRRELADETERRRAIVALTDGVSGGCLKTAIRAATEAGVAIYAIGMGDVDAMALGQLAEDTGGRFYRLSPEPTAEELTKVYDDIRKRLRCQYTLIYETPHVCPDGLALPLRVAVSSLDRERDGQYRRPLNDAQLDFNLSYSSEHGLQVEPPEPFECEKVKFLSRIRATSCSDQLVFENIVVRAYDVRSGDRVEVAKSEPIRVQSNGPPVAAVVEWDTRNFPGERKLELVIDPVDEILEVSEEDNIRTVRVKVNERIHDLYIESIEYTPKPAAPCDVVELAVAIDDGGPCKGVVLRDVVVEARDGERSLGRAVTTLKAGEPETVSFEWEADGFIGHRPLTFEVNPDRSVDELTFGNNLKQALIEVEPVLHELQPLEVTYKPEDPLVGDVVVFQVTVEDRGRCPGVEIGRPVILRASDGESRRILAQSEFTIRTEDRTVVSLAWETRLNDEGAHDVVLTVDPGGVIRERDKENNSIEQRLVIGPMPHDLRIEAVEITPEVPVDGEPASLRVLIEDDARFPGIRIDGVRVKVFVRDRDLLVLVGESEATSVISQGTTLLEIGIDTGGLAGHRELRVVVDPDNEIKELTPTRRDGENNNEFILKVNVAAPGSGQAPR